jgi:nicotinate-nucleotide pyrophosphorylase (carboxylating)
MLDLSIINDLIQKSLDEDFAAIGDITTKATIPPSAAGKAIMRSRRDGVAAGIKVAEMVFNKIDPSLNVTIFVKSGERVKPGTDFLCVEGSAASILSAERTALNFVTHLSGIATHTRRYVDLVAHTDATILDTRKTLPGLRALQKYAVASGGGTNHRFGLYDAILIKDNHIAVAGGIASALDAVKGRSEKIEIEVDTLDQLQDVLDHGGAQVVLLDNMDIPTLTRAVAMAKRRILTEASGGVNLDTVRSIAETGVDYISIGAITHSAPALDVGLDIEI